MNQPLSLVEQLKSLEQLQELDLKIDSIKKNQHTLPAALKALEASLNQLKATGQSKKNQISEIEKIRRQTHAALELNRDRLTRATSKLEQVQNSQEFQAANKEIEQLKKLNQSLEEQDKKSVLDLEAIQKEFQAVESETQKLQQERDQQATVVSGQNHQLDSDLAQLLAERNKYSHQIDARTLSKYDRIRGARGGLGIVPAIGGRCKGCNMMVPAQLYNEIQRGTVLHFCPSCHRILYVPSQPGETAENVEKTGT